MTSNVLDPTRLKRDASVKNGVGGPVPIVSTGALRSLSTAAPTKPAPAPAAHVADIKVDVRGNAFGLPPTSVCQAGIT